MIKNRFAILDLLQLKIRYFFPLIFNHSSQIFFNFVIMEITQDNIDFAQIKIENHLRDLGIKNNFSLSKDILSTIL